MLLLSMAVVGVNAWEPPHSPDETWLWAPHPKFVNSTDIRGTLFNVSVSVYNVLNLSNFEWKLGYDTDLLDAVRCYKGQIIDEYFTMLLPSPWSPTLGINDAAGFVYFGAGTLLDKNNPFTTSESATMLTIAFNITAAPPYDWVEVPTNETVTCPLGIYYTSMEGVGPPPDWTPFTIDPECDNGTYTWIRPQPVVGYPTAIPKVTPDFVYVGSNVTFDGTQSKDGLPPDVEDNVNITRYDWDVNSDGTFEINTTEPTVEWGPCTEPGIFNVTLIVRNSADKVSDPVIADWEVGVMAGGILDLFSETEREYPKGTTTTFIGKMAGTPCDSYAPGEDVTVFAEVTYNGAPVNHVLVAFEAIDPKGYSWTYRTAETDDTGIATVSFRIPVPDELPWLFGHWNVNATCMLVDVKLSDYMEFSVGWILEITDLSTTYAGEPETTFYQGDEVMDVKITLKNIALIMKPVHLVVTVYDEPGVPIFRQIAYQSDIPAGAFCSPTTTYHYIYFMKIPMWAFVGKGKVYVSAYTDLPKNFGVPYCPEVSADITIKEYPRP